MECQSGQEFFQKIFGQVCGGNGFEVIESDFQSEENFSCVLRTNIQLEPTASHAENCELWKRRFAIAVNCDMIFLKQHSSCRTYVYRKVYVCHFHQKNKARELKRNILKPRCDHDCSDTKLDFKVLHDNHNQRRKDALLRAGLDTSIQITFKHTHRVNVAEHVSMLKMADSVKADFLQYFEDGMSPAAALAFHDMLLLDRVGEDRYIEESACSKISPLYGQVYHLYDEWRRERFGGRDQESMVEKLRSKKEEYEKLGITLHIEENPMVIVIITPIMRRAHEQDFAGEIVFVDSSGSCDQGNTVVTFMFAANKTGGIPLACVLHADQTETTYKAAFRAVREAAGEKAFGGKGAPATIMSDDSNTERGALKTEFPTSILLLCIFHVCQALWRWLWESSHGVKKECRKTLMSLFRGVLYAPDADSCERKMNGLRENGVTREHKKFRDHVEKLWDRRKEWCLSARVSAVTRGHNTNNIIEASMRILKDLVLQRCKSFNAVALVDFICKVLERYHHRRLLSFTTSHSTNKPELQFRRFLVKSKDLKVTKVSDSEYTVSSASSDGEIYEVNTELELCNCPYGIGGRFCKHLCAVHVQEDVHLLQNPRLTADDKVQLVYLATGKKPKRDFYESMRLDEGQCSSAPSRGPSAIAMDCQDVPHEVPHEVPQAEPQTEKVEEQAAALRCELERIISMCTDPAKADENMVRNMKVLCGTLQRVTSVPKFQELCRKIRGGTSSGGKTIRVQPTAMSRRLKRSGLTSGAKRIQAGRPSKMEQALNAKKTAKRQHNLSQNISNNVPNARSHATGM